MPEERGDVWLCLAYIHIEAAFESLRASVEAVARDCPCRSVLESLVDRYHRKAREGFARCVEGVGGRPPSQCPLGAEAPG